MTGPKRPAPSNVVPINDAVTAAPLDTAANLYAVERAAIHLLDLAMRVRRDHDLTGELAPGMLDALTERLDRCAIMVAGVVG